MEKIKFRLKKNLIKMALLTGSFLSFVSCDAVLEAATATNYPAGNQANQSSYGGNYTNQGDTNRSGTFTMQLSQNAAEISGTARYSNALGEDSGLLSVLGNVNNGVANIRFLNQSGNEVARGVISPNQGNFSFIQNGNSKWIPVDTLMWRN